MAQPCLRTPERAKRPPGTSVREAPFKLVRDVTKDGQPDDGLTLDGYGAVFNRLTVIDSWEGRFREQIAPGSMKRSFRETPPKIQFDHGRHPLIGSWTIGSPVQGYPREESDPERAPDGGAHIIARVFDRWYTEPVRDGISVGAIDGMSFRFEVVQESWAMSDGTPIRDEAMLQKELDRTYFGDVPEDELLIRTLRQLKVPEMGPVTWPAYEDTSVGLRSKVIYLGRLQERGQRKLLARAVFMADQLDNERAEDEPADTPDADDDPAALAGSLDAVLDEASELISGVDLSTLPPEVAQACALITAAETVADELLEAMGIYDPDDDESGEDSGRSGQQPANTAGKHPKSEQRPARVAGEHSETGQLPAQVAGERHSNPNPRAFTDMQLRVMNQRDRLLTLRTIGERP